MNRIERLRCAALRLTGKARRGIAAIEFALTLPIWITLLLGTSDGVYYMLVSEKTDRVAYTITDIVTQYQSTTLGLTNLNDIVQAAGQLMQPYSFTTNGTVLITSVYKPPGLSPVIVWQYKGGGSLVQTSQIGICAGPAKLPNGLVLNDSDNVIVAEVFYNFKPMFVSTNLFPATLVYRTAIYKPRLGPLSVIPVGLSC